MTAQLMEVAMPKPTGPTVARWQLGEALKAYRDAAGMEFSHGAKALGCSESKIRKIEEARIGISNGDLHLLLSTYGVTDPAVFDDLTEKARQGKERGYWTGYGNLPTSVANFLGMETAAQVIRIFEPLVVHGLLQTPDYARALIDSTWLPGAGPTEQQVRLRLERQQLVLGDDPPELWVILDEAVIRRHIGGPEVMRAQLEHLVELGRHNHVSIQIIPFAHGGYHGTLGPLTVLEFDEDFHSPICYVESQAGSMFLEKEADLRRSNVAFNHMSAAALSPAETVKLIRAAVKEL